MKTTHLQAFSLASGSSGNCYFIRGGGSAVLLDAGITMKAVTTGLSGIGARPEEIAGIFVTHEHSDHVKGIGPLSRRYGIPVYANQPTLEALPAMTGEINARPLPIGQETEIGDLSVRSFRLPHDGVCHVGYAVSCGGRSICLATDVGFVCEPLKEEIGNCDLLILESNHDVRMLEEGPYPYFMKKRIRGSGGHMSNDEAARALVECCRPGRRQVWLAHLSGINNSPQVALATSRRCLEHHGRLQEIRLSVAARDVPSLSWDSGA